MRTHLSSHPFPSFLFLYNNFFPFVELQCERRSLWVQPSPYLSPSSTSRTAPSSTWVLTSSKTTASISSTCSSKDFIVHKIWEVCILTNFGVFRVFAAIVFGAMAIGQMAHFAPDAGKASAAGGRLFQLLDREPAINSMSEEGSKPVGNTQHLLCFCFYKIF